MMVFGPGKRDRQSCNRSSGKRGEDLLVQFITLSPRAHSALGAFGVGRMSTVLDDAVTNTGKAGKHQDLEPAPSFDRAQELGRFELGSTVILLAEPGALEWTIQPGEAVRLGRPIARRAGA